MKLALSFLVLILLGERTTASTKVMPLGDSITEGIADNGSYRRDLVPRILSIRSDVHFVGSKSSGPATLTQPFHEGHSGWRIDELVLGRLYGNYFEEGIKAWLPAHPPDIILLMIGTNDIVQNYFLDEAAQRYEFLLNKIFELNPHVTVLTASLISTNNDELNQRIIGFNKALKELIPTIHPALGSAQFVDMNGELRPGWGPEDLIDGVHPSIQGNSKIAQIWFNHLAPVIGSRP